MVITRSRYRRCKEGRAESSGRVRFAEAKLTRSQKREQRHVQGLMRARNGPQQQARVEDPISRGELQQLQRTDPSLEGPRKKAADRQVREYFWRGGTLFHIWKFKHPSRESEVEQVVLPQVCRRSVLRIAHAIPVAGHLARRKTTSRILRRFYWPTLFRDVADYCRSCPECQESSHKRPGCAPMGQLNHRVSTNFLAQGRSGSVSEKQVFRRRRGKECKEPDGCVGDMQYGVCRRVPLLYAVT